MKYLPAFPLLCALFFGLGAATSRAASPAKPPPTGELEKRFGLGVAERLLASKDERDRMRGMERIAVLGSPQAFELVGRVLESEAGKSARLRLVAVRSLARWAAEREARVLLGRLMATGDSARDRGNELDPWIRVSAALALGASQEVEAVQALGRALRHEGPVAAAAAEALVAYPPRELDPVLKAPGRVTLILVDTLERLADQRAFVFLRELVRSDSPAIRGRAALALTRLGDYETVELARYWLARERAPELRYAAAWILALAHTSDAPGAVAALLRDPATRAQGLELGLALPHRDLVGVLDPLLNECGDDCDLVLAVLGRAGGARALGSRLGDSKLGRAAAYALALCPDGAARGELERALGRPDLVAIAARAAVVRKVVLREGARGLADALEALLGSPDPDRRAAGAWGLSTLDAARAQKLLGSSDRVIVRASARALVGSPQHWLVADRWEREADPLTRAALGVALLTSAGASRIRTQTLMTRLAAGDPLAPLLARALAERDSADLRPRVQTLLESGDPWIRAHAALGLGRSQHPGALALLDHAYRFEPEVEVRRAIVRALSRRSEPSRERTLRLARDLDPDLGVRSASRLAFTGQRLPEWEPGAGAVWLDVVPSAADPNQIPAVALVSTPAGLMVPGVTDPGGMMVMTGLPRGEVHLRMAVISP